MLTPTNLRSVLGSLAPRALDSVSVAYGHLLEALSVLSIQSDLRQAHFLAEGLMETGEFRRVEENLSYSAAGLIRVFSKYFPTLHEAKAAQYQPELIANTVYGGRMGNTESGDGWRFRGRGVFQLTGRENYAAVGKRAGLPLEEEPDLVCDPQHMFWVAGHYWNMRGLSRFADADDLEGLARRLNGGTNGLSARRAYLLRVKSALRDA